MKKRSRQGLRRFRVEVRSWGNYVERISELERALAKKPRTLQIEIVGTGEMPADVALRFRTALRERSPKTRIVTNAHSSLQGGSVLLWLLGDRRIIRDDARLYFRRSTLSEDDEVQENGAWQDAEPAYRDSYSAIDPDEHPLVFFGPWNPSLARKRLLKNHDARFLPIYRFDPPG